MRLSAESSFYSEDKVHRVCFWTAAWGAQQPSNMAAHHPVHCYWFSKFLWQQPEQVGCH